MITPGLKVRTAIAVLGLLGRHSGSPQLIETVGEKRVRGRSWGRNDWVAFHKRASARHEHRRQVRAQQRQERKRAG